MTSPEPEDSHTVSPDLVVDGAGATIDFLAEVFDAVELRRFPAEDGRLSPCRAASIRRPVMSEASPR